MKTFFIALCTFNWSIAVAQNTTPVISMKEDKVTQLIFPHVIKSFKGGFLPSDFAISAEGNVVYIQPVAPFQESNLNIITQDGYYYTFTVKYDPQTSSFNYIIDPEQAIYREKGAAASKDEKPSDKGSEYSAACRKILRENGYLLTRNIVKVKNFSMLLKGVYIDTDYMYLRLQFDNTSNIKYDMETLTFYVEAVVKGKASTQEKTQLIPVYIYNDVSAINPKSSLELVCCFDKFTINDEKALFISVIEKDGERNLNLQVHNNIILEARRYE